MSDRAWLRIQGLSWLSGGVPVVAALILGWWPDGPLSGSVAARWTLTVGVVGCYLIAGLAARERWIDRLRTFTGVVNAVREGDYTVRVSGGSGTDPLSELAGELNALVTVARERRLTEHETGALLGKVLAEIDAGIFTFDERQRLRLVNRRGADWLGRSPAELLGVSARALGLAPLLEGEVPRVETIALPASIGRCELRRGVFRERGRPHRLVVLHDLSRTLAAEERLAWRRLVQVLRHELNNSLAPIRSIATTLRGMLARGERSEAIDVELGDGLDVIISRSSALARLLAAYAQLTRLPPPTPSRIELGACVRRVAALETRRTVTVESGNELWLSADPDQLEQALINLVRNAVDAALETDGEVAVRWHRAGDDPQVAEVVIEDGGPGLSGSQNLFVPFFTTKPDGTGIGLVLARQVVEAHGGRLELTDRSSGPGCEARVRLPIAGPLPEAGSEIGTAPSRPRDSIPGPAAR